MPRSFSPATPQASSPAAISWSTAAIPRSEHSGPRPSRPHCGRDARGPDVVHSNLEPLQDRAVGAEGGGEQPAAATGAGVERDRELALDNAAHLPIEAADHP